MSAYMNFFLRGEDRFYPIGTYSRNSAIYEIFEEYTMVPWEKIMPVTKNVLANLQHNINENIEGFQNRIKTTQEKIEHIKTMNNSVEEKMECLNEEINWITDIEERIEELEKVKSFMNVLDDILQEAKDSHYYEDKSRWLDENMYVYVGIEIGNPTVESIVE